MKIRFQYSYFLALAVLFVSCAEDNYTEPKANLSGRVVYNGEPLGFEFNQVALQLWQPGFGKLAAINAPIDQEGNFSSILFNGDYKLVFPKGRGPFRTIVQDASKKDTVFVTVNGTQQLDISVEPYYLIKSATFSGGEKKVSVTAALEKIIKDVDAKEIENVTLYINQGQFVSRATNIGSKSIGGAEIANLTSINLTVDVPTILPTQSYVYARIGVKIKNVEDMLFSAVEKVSL